MPALPFRQTLVAGLLVAAPLVLTVALPGALAAQTIVTIAPQQCVWRAGDNPAWAASNLDETGWLPFTGFEPPANQPRFWIRCNLDRTGFRNLEHPAVQIRMFSAYEAFLNGVAIARFGNLQNGNFSQNLIRVFPVPLPLANDPRVLAFRVAQRYTTQVTTEIQLGDEQALINDRAGYLLSIMPVELLKDLPYFAIGIVGLVLLVFSLPERSHPEAILLGVSCVAVGLVLLGYLCSNLMLNEPIWLSEGLVPIAGAVSLATQFLFPFALAKRRVPAFFWLPISVPIFAAAWQIVELFVPMQAAIRLDSINESLLSALVYGAAALIGAAPLVAFWHWSSVPRPVRAIAGFSLAWGFNQSLFFAAEVTSFNIPGIPNLLQNWMFPASSVSQVCVIAAIIVLILRDQRHIVLQRASLAGEMLAASEIQKMLAPAVIDTAPGLRIEVAFHPMRDVGGDFYLCRVLPDGRQRVLLGDVSGKGAAAAMAATLLLGAAAARDSDSPASLLTHLNRVLRENHLSGFATCLCADLATNGRLTLANAGHLPPYRDGRETEVESCLPLGISAETEFYETTLGLSPGDSLTFLSDGVVEARNSQGELFGFDRTCEISAQSAESIAQTAQAFGQEDDITVLTVTLVPVEVAHA